MNIVKDEKGDLVTGFPCILARWRNHFYQLLRGLMMSDRLKYRQESHKYLSPVPFRLRWLLKS